MKKPSNRRYWQRLIKQTDGGKDRTKAHKPKKEVKNYERFIQNRTLS